MEDVTFRVVEIDGTLADVRQAFNGIASAVLDRPIEAEELPPPHTIARLGAAAYLSSSEIEAVRDTVREIRDFWAGLPAIHAAPIGGTEPRDLPFCELWVPVYHARRLQTRGRPVLLQTIEWLIRQGYENPVVWIEED